MTPPHPTSPSPPGPPAKATPDDLGAYLDQAMRDPAFRGAYHDVCARSHLLGQLTGLRTSQGISQAQAARAMRASRSLVTRLDVGGTDPCLSTLQRYARAVGARLTLTLICGPLTPPPGQDARPADSTTQPSPQPQGQPAVTNAQLKPGNAEGRTA